METPRPAGRYVRDKATGACTRVDENAKPAAPADPPAEAVSETSPGKKGK